MAPLSPLFLFAIVASASSKACQDSPVDFEDVRGTSREMPAMHVSYGSWHRDDVAASVNRSQAFSWKYPMDGGTIRIGSSYATAATCILRRLTVWPRLHLMLDDSVAAEVHLEHECLSSNLTSEQDANRHLLEEVYSAAIKNVSATQEDINVAKETKRWCAVAESTCGGCLSAQHNLSSTKEAVHNLTRHLEQMQELCRLLADGYGVRKDAPDACTHGTIFSRRLSPETKHCEARETKSWPSLRQWYAGAGEYQHAVDAHRRYIESLQNQQKEMDEYAVIEASYHKEMKLDRAVLVKHVIASDRDGPQHPLVRFILSDGADIEGHEAVFGVKNAEAKPGLHYEGGSIGMQCEDSEGVDWFLLSPAVTNPQSYDDLYELVHSESNSTSWRDHPEWLFAHAPAADLRLENVALTSEKLLPPRYSQDELATRKRLFLSIMAPILVAPPLMLEMLLLCAGERFEPRAVGLIFFIVVTAIAGLVMMHVQLSAPYLPFFSCLKWGWRWWEVFALPQNFLRYVLVLIQWPLSLVLTVVRLIFWLLVAVVTVFLMMAYPAFAWPVVAYAGGSTNCIDGIDWEVHIAFTLSLALNTFFWYALSVSYRTMPERLFYRFVEYGKFLLVNLDVYSDLIFVNIAMACHTSYGAPSLWLFVVGVVVCQWLLPLMVLGLLVFCCGCGLDDMLVFHLLQLPYPSVTEEAGRAKLSTHLLRISFEDLPQLFLQYRFTMTVKKNPLIIFSMAISLLGAFGSLALSIKEAFCRDKEWRPLK